MRNAVALDTHTLIWSLFKPRYLGKASENLIKTASLVLVSTISLAEIEIKSIAGKLKFPAITPALLKATNFELVTFDADAANEIGRFGGLSGHDPFDRMLLAQASANDAYFVTADSVLLGQGLDFVVDAES
jgi:PIN domain nuclease of toxin-antitoxin system